MNDAKESFTLNVRMAKDSDLGKSTPALGLRLLELS